MVQRLGLAAVEHLVGTLEITYPDFGRAFFLHDLIASAGLPVRSRSQMRTFVASLENRHRTGTFFPNAVGYTVVGTRLQ